MVISILLNIGVVKNFKLYRPFNGQKANILKENVK